MECFFVTDLHGSKSRFYKLFDLVGKEIPAGLFIGGDIVPAGGWQGGDFIVDYLGAELDSLKSKLGPKYPRVFLILGNDDPRVYETSLKDITDAGLCEYIHNQRVNFGEFSVYGYNYVPPSPFMLKDWERYDVSRYVDPGCIPPTEGHRSVPVSKSEAEEKTIKEDMELLVGTNSLEKSLFLFHAPPYKCALDRAALDGQFIDYVPLDVNVGSIAIRRFIEERQPLVTLHGHVHESARLTGEWQEKIGKTHAYSAAHDGPELAVVCFDPTALEGARRILI